MPELARHGSEIRTVPHAWRDFVRRPSPRAIALLFAAGLALRILAGDPTWWDAAAVLAMLVIYPFGEWAIHVYLLHMPPLRWRGRRVESPTAIKHRQHHEAPTELGLILLGTPQAAALLLVIVPLVSLSGWAAATIVAEPPLASAVTGALTGYLLVGVYEWTHFLIHTAHRPRSRYFRRIWRTHRLHHYKNEHYWHGITQPIADTVLGTDPDQREIPRSPTARTLHGV